MGNAAPAALQAWCIAVHPHAHGERLTRLWAMLNERGSSPRTWGTLLLAKTSIRRLRFIPTHMGNAHRRRGSYGVRTVHPHAHGERWPSAYTDQWVGGSSPRTWGTRYPRQCLRRFRRFIPTHMGNARTLRSAWRERSVHPHAHGERLRTLHHHRPLCGSSPRTWGTRSDLHSAELAYRFIPTHMGNAPSSSLPSRSSSVHPHAHGERSSTLAVVSSFPGSSPRTWGTPACWASECCRTRFIPTHMGNAVGQTCPLTCSAVHPHAHGERTPRSVPLTSTIGSSPRTWGTLVPMRCQDMRTRFIPTHMGNARKTARLQILVSVHPHAHGER